MTFSSEQAIAGTTAMHRKFTSYFKTISPYAVGVIIFLIIYFRMCTNKSDQIGNDYFERGEFKTALSYYNEYLNLEPHDINTLYNRGRCLEELGFPDEAAADFEQVLDRDPDNVKALLSLSQYYYELEKYDLTINLCSSATRLDKDNYLARK